MSRKKITTGIAVSVDAAISAPQSVFRLVPRKYESQTVSVCFAPSFRRVRAKMYSFQVVMNAKTDVATRPGRDERQQDLDERAEPGAPVHHRRLLEVLRDAEDEPAQRLDREREHERSCT